MAEAEATGKGTGRLAWAATAALVIHTLTAAPAAYAAGADLTAMAALQDGATLYMDQIGELETLTGTFLTIRLVAAIAAGTTFLAWYANLAGKNPAEFGNRPLAVAAWLIPPFLAYAPLLKARALLKRTPAQDSRPRAKRRKAARQKQRAEPGAPPWIYLWWLAWLTALGCEQAAAGILTASGTLEPTAENVDSWLATLALADTLKLMAYAAYVPAAAGAVAYIRALTKKFQPNQEGKQKPECGTSRPRPREKTFTGRWTKRLIGF